MTRQSKKVVKRVPYNFEIVVIKKDGESVSVGVDTVFMPTKEVVEKLVGEKIIAFAITEIKSVKMEMPLDTFIEHAVNVPGTEEVEKAGGE